MKSRFIIFWVRLTNWEYWPWQIVYIPIFIYWLWCGLKTRAIFWINAVNPGFEYGGIIGSSKKAILDKIPAQFRPKTILVKSGTPILEIFDRLQQNEIEFPLIIKPDIGERGFHVELVDNRSELEQYLASTAEDHLLQEYLDLPLELGIFYYRLPIEPKGKVTSVVEKSLLTVTGDGKSTLRQLMQQDTRALQQINRLAATGKIDFASILAKDERRLLEPIGNHIRGTTFLDATHLINEQLNGVFNDLATQIEGFYYGRFDIRCASIKALYKGDFKVMEVNGAASEPAHIYAPNYPISKGYQVLFQHWRALYRISVLNHEKGVPYMSFKTGWGAIKKSRFART